MPLRDSIITSKTAERMLQRVSPIYDDSYVGLWMFEAIGREYDKLWDVVNTFAAQLFPETVTWAIELWERRYGLASTPDLSLEERRQRILAMRSTPKPFNAHSVKAFIRTMYGRESEIVDYVSPFTFGVYLTSSEEPKEIDIQDISSYLDKHKPSHMSYELGFQSVFNIGIGVETGYWRFPYGMAGTAVAGQLPDFNTGFAGHEGDLHIDPDVMGYPIPYEMAGTLPEINITSGEQGATIRASPEYQGFTINYSPCGVANSGAGIL